MCRIKINMKNIIKIVIGAVLCALVFVAYYEYETGLWFVQMGEPIDHKYVYRVNHKGHPIQVPAVKWRGDIGKYSDILNSDTINGLPYYKDIKYISFDERTVGVYKYLDIDGDKYALIGYYRQMSRFGGYRAFYISER